MLVFLSEDLEQTQTEIIAAGGEINVPTFDFPGGKREPSGNEFTVWFVNA